MTEAMEEPNYNQTSTKELPQCKIKRNYSCSQCSYFTQNPRFYLTHLREIHGEKIKINNCNLCLYASRHYQKLVRHMKMVHGSTADAIPGQSKKRILPEDVISDSYPPLLPPPPKWTFDIDSLSYDLKSSRNTLKDIAALYFATEEFKPFLARMEESDVVEVVPLKNSFVPFKACNKLIFDYPESYKSQEENLTCFCGHISKCLAESVAHKKFCILSNENQDVAPLDLSLGSKKSEIGSIFDQPNKNDGANLVTMGSDLEKTSDVNVEHVNLSVTEFEKEKTLPEKFKVEQSGIEKSQQISTSEEFSYKKVYKCSRCSFWASTASRFHVHIVGHHNKKPFKCSLCAYRSNWRWDITKHIRLRTIRSPSHKNARVIIYGDTGVEKDYNYAKYINYMTFIKIPRGSKLMKCGEMPSSPNASLEMSTDFDKEIEKTTIDKEILKLNKQDTFLNDRTMESPLVVTNADTTAHERLLSSNGLKQNNPRDYLVSSFLDGEKNLVFKCSKCSFKHANRDAVLVHIKVLHQDLLSTLPTSSNAYSSSSLIQDNTIFSETDSKVKTEAFENSSTGFSNKCSKNSPKGEENSSDLLEIDIENTKEEAKATSAVKGTTIAISCSKTISQANDKPFSNNEVKGSKIPSPFRCWHCRQESNWKHVIQRHCRLKHSGDIRIESLDRNSDAPVYRPLELGGIGQSYHVVGPSAQNSFNHNNNNNVLNKNDHYPEAGSPVYRDQKYKPEIPLNHNEITNLSANNTKAASNKCKQQKCPSCPYISESKSQMNYHISLHKPTQYECNLCSYICTKKQHLSNHVKAMHEIGGPFINNAPAAKNPRSKQSNESDDEKVVSKVISYCPKCPTRFVNSLKNLIQHLKGHGACLEYKCKACDYSTKQETNLLSHSFVHTSTYQEKIKKIGKCAKEDAEYPAQKVEQISFPKTGETVWVVADIVKDVSTSYKNLELLAADDEANKGTKPMAVVSKCDVKNQENTQKAEKEKDGPSTSRSSLRLSSRSSIQNEEKKLSPPLAPPSSHKTILVNPKTGQVIRKN